MNANAFRHFFDYHFSVNRRIWESSITPLTYEQFTQPVDYSHGSVRDQVIHMLDVDDVWFSELMGVQPAEPIPAASTDDRAAIRAHWDAVEQKMRAYLTDLKDEMLFDKPITEPEEDKNLIVWQVLLHVVNHATDHRAQLLRAVHDLGGKTEYQDYIFYAYARPVG